MTEAKITPGSKSTLDKFKECKAIKFEDCKEKLWSQIEVGQADGTTKNMDIYRLEWTSHRSAIYVNIFEDGTSQIDAIYERRTVYRGQSTTSLARRKETFLPAKVDKAVKYLVNIFNDRVLPRNVVLVPFPCVVPVNQN